MSARRVNGNVASAGFLLALAAAAVLAGDCPVAAQSSQPDAVSARTEAVLRPGDMVRISVWRKPELSGEYEVTDDNTVAAPFYLGVRVGGVPFPEAVARIRAHIARYESEPQVLVEPLFRVAVGGEVQRPDVYTLGPWTTVRQAVLLAGGATERGNLRRVQLFRAGEQLRVDLRNPLDPLGGLTVRSGDHLVVERTRPVFQEYVMPTLLAIGATASIARLLIR
jgi:protein involved in polysaccharide export with SLBB domain